jgi:poly(3-hydroxybutyrate) depolymerase
MSNGTRWMVFVSLVALGACGDDSAGSDVGNDTPDVADVVDTGADADADVAPDAADDAAGPDAEADADAEAESDVPALTCDDLAEGWNRGLPAGGLSRDFILDLPADVETGGPWPVVFSFHGLGDTADNMRTLLSSAVDNATFPFILVTPEDTDFMLAGLMSIDWEVGTVTADNREAAMFDAILACLESRWGVDENHVHVVGFSMGGFVADALGTVRGEQLASTITYSGAYGNDSTNLAGLGMLTSFIVWPAYETVNRYAQVLLHGGTTDTYNAMVATMHFDTFAANDSAFLGGLGHDTFVCNHGGGHTVPVATFGANQIVEFFRDHPLGTVASPYASGLPADWPAYCSYVPATAGADADADADADGSTD